MCTCSNAHIQIPRIHTLTRTHPCTRHQVSPNDGAVLTTDSFGRVLMLDSASGTLVWVWKGYRDAQCGWLVAVEGDDSSADLGTAATSSTLAKTSAAGGRVAPTKTDEDDDEDRSPPRSCALVIIYAPQRGLLEIWAPWFGHRVAAFNVGLHCQLLVQTPPRILGGAQGMRKGGGCALIMPDGSMRDIVREITCAPLASVDKSHACEHCGVCTRTLGMIDDAMAALILEAREA